MEDLEAVKEKNRKAWFYSIQCIAIDAGADPSQKTMEEALEAIDYYCRLCRN